MILEHPVFSCYFGWFSFLFGRPLSSINSMFLKILFNAELIYILPFFPISLSKFDFLYFLRSIKPSALFASLGFLSFDKPIFQWFQYYKHYIYRIESKQIFAPHHIKHKAKMNNLLAFFLFGAFCFNHLNKFHFPFICSFNFCLLFA